MAFLAGAAGGFAAATAVGAVGFTKPRPPPADATVPDAADLVAAAGADACGNCFIAACVAGPMMPSALILAPLAIKSCCCFKTAGC